MYTIKTLSELWLEVGGPFWAKNDTGWYFYCTGISPNELCVGWNENGSSSCWDADTNCWTLLDHDPTKPKPRLYLWEWETHGFWHLFETWLTPVGADKNFKQDRGYRSYRISPLCPEGIEDT